MPFAALTTRADAERREAAAEDLLRSAISLVFPPFRSAASCRWRRVQMGETLPGVARYPVPTVALTGLFAAAVTACGSTASEPPPSGHDSTPKPVESRPVAGPQLQPPITTLGLAEISGTASNDIWAVGSKGVTVHYNGKLWSVVPSGTSVDLLGVYTSGNKDAWAVGDTEVVLRWDGSSWSPVVASSSGVLIGVWGSSQSDVWAVGIDSGTAFFRRWDGAQWDFNWLDSAPSFWDVWGSGPDDVWAVGSAGPDTGHAFRYDGSVMNQMEYSGPPLRSINGSAPNDVWIVAQGNPMEHWDGSAFDVPPGPPIDGTLFDVWASSTTNAWACGTGGQMLHWDGSEWTSVSVGTTQTLQGLWGTDEDNVWAVGGGGTILHFDGKAWSSVFTTPAVPDPSTTPAP